MTLSLEIARHSLTPCYYVALWCPNCGEMRAGLPENPATTLLPCPSCRGRGSDFSASRKGRYSPCPAILGIRKAVQEEEKRTTGRLLVRLTLGLTHHPANFAGSQLS